MRTAICMSGYSESIKYVKDNLKEYFDKYIGDYDVYAYVPTSDQAWNIEHYFPNATVKIIDDQPIDERGIQGEFKTGVQRWLQQINGWKQSNLMRKESGIDYDFIIRCRPDVRFRSPWFHIKNAKRDRVYIPHFHHWLGGINDRFCIAPPDLIDNYMNLIDHAMDRPHEAHHAESFLKSVLIHTNTPIELIPTYFDRIRSDGSLAFPSGDNGFDHLDYPETLIRTGTHYE